MLSWGFGTSMVLYAKTPGNSSPFLELHFEGLLDMQSPGTYEQLPALRVLGVDCHL